MSVYVHVFVGLLLVDVNVQTVGIAISPEGSTGPDKLGQQDTEHD